VRRTFRFYQKARGSDADVSDFDHDLNQSRKASPSSPLSLELIAELYDPFARVQASTLRHQEDVEIDTIDWQAGGSVD